MKWIVLLPSFLLWHVPSILAQECVDNLVLADQDGDAFLTRAEFSVLLQLESNCANPDSLLDLDIAQQGAYAAAVTAQCVRDGSALECLLGIGDRQLSIAGADSTTGRTEEETESLQAVCDAVSLLSSVDCAEIPGIIDDDEDEPGDDTIDDDDNSKCYDDLLGADVDGDEALSLEEFSLFIQLQSNCTSLDSFLELDLVQQAAYTAVVTAQCIDGESPLTCVLGGSSRNMSIAGVGSSVRTDKEAQDLDTVCASVNLLRFAECTLGDSPIVGDNSYENCSEALSNADVDGSETLTREEFRLFLNDFNDCNETDRNGLSLAEEAAFSAAACTSGSSLECLTNQDATIDVSLSVMNNTALLSTICLPAERLQCPDGVPKELDADCVEYLVEADTNGDQSLTQDEFSLLVQLQSNCSVLDSLLDLDLAQQGVYTAAVAAQCLGEGMLADCLSDLGNRFLSIEGAASVNPTMAETESLQAICDAVELLRVVDCPNTTIDIIGPGNPDDIDLDECTAALKSADIDGSVSIGRLEYRFFLKDYNECNNLPIGLNTAEQAVFSALSCLSDSSLQCLLEPANAKIDISDSVLSSNALLNIICSTTARLPCQEDGETPVDIPVETPELTQECVDSLLQADENSDGALTVEEYLGLVVQLSGPQDNVDCKDVEYELKRSQRIVFQGLACTSCVADGQVPTCCLEDSETAVLSVSDASIDATLEQSAFLTSICTAAEQGGFESSCNDGPPTVPGDLPTPSPVGFTGTCENDIKSADGSQDGFLDSGEFYDFVLMNGSPYCYDSGGELSPTMSATFRTIACTSCTTNGDGVFCCTRGIEDARISVELETIVTATCVAIRAEVGFSSCGDDTPMPTLMPTSSPVFQVLTDEMPTENRDVSGSVALMASLFSAASWLVLTLIL